MNTTNTVHVALLVAAFALTAAAQDPDRIAGNEASAIGALKTILTAQSLFREGDKDGNGELDYAPNLEALAKEQLIRAELGTGTYRGYTFKVTVSPKHPEFQWMATATPVKSGATGQRSFAVSHTGVIYHALKPFAHNADSKLTGVPVGKTLKGWVKVRSKPEGPWGKVIRAAQKAKTLQAFGQDAMFFLAPRGEVKQVMYRIRRRSGRFDVDVVHMSPKTMLARVSSSRLDDQGRLRSLKIEQVKFPPQQRPDRVRRVARKGATVTIFEPGKEKRTIAWNPNTITLSQALFLLPSLFDHLPKGLTLTLARDGEPVAGELKVAVTGDADRTVTLTHTKLGTAVVVVAGSGKREIKSWKDFAGVTWKATTSDKARQAFMAQVKGPAKAQLEAARSRAYEAAAKGALKTISASQSLFREADKDGNGKLDYASDIAALGKASLIDDVLASGTKQGYRFKVTRSTQSPEFKWMATATPVKPGKLRCFAITHTGVMYHALKPFAHNDACTIKGVPVGKRLPGWNPAPSPVVTANPHEGEVRTLGVLRAIGMSQSLFREGDKDKDGKLDYANSLKELIDTQLLMPSLVKRAGYRFTVCAGSDAPEFTWMVTAAPIKPGKTGNRHFASNHEGVIFYSDKPIALDKVKCLIPTGLQPVGK